MKKTLSLSLRSIALFVILFQFRLIADDLADTGVFVFTTAAGFGIAVALSFVGTNNIAALVVMGLAPWVCRFFIAAPRLFIPESTDSAAILLDSLLLNLDRNNFVSLFPFYWGAVSTWFSFRSRKFLRAAIIADASLLLVVYSIAKTANIELYRFPVVMIAIFAAVVFLQALSLLFSMPPETKLRVKEICFAAAAILVIVITGGFLFIKPIQERAVEMGGGLLEPKFFSFDFSKFLRLDPEISVKSDLILIVKKENDNHILLRRSVLSGYSRKNGFYKIEEMDERTHPQRLPFGYVSYSPRDFELARYSLQEYFLVNIESSAFVGMKEPAAVFPYESWDASSFKSAYAVESRVSDATIWDLTYSTGRRDGVHIMPNAEELGLSEDEFKIYTEYGNDERLRALALEITEGHERYSDKVNAVHNYLKYGDYRYSLKPGIAPDGDQLGWFLFQSKKGYCSYYAFAMTLLLRSVGIPARVAAGFFTDPETNTFDYYPVRSDMAHAWVEVPFPRYGWIEYDPTTERLAENEEFQFSSGVDPALFEKLMKEILENRSKMKTRGIMPEDAAENIGSKSFAQNTMELLRKNWLIILFILLALTLIFIRFGLYFMARLAKNPRKKAILLMKHACHRLRLSGVRRADTLAESEWALQIDGQFKGIYALYQGASAARFAKNYSKEDYKLQWEVYKRFRIKKSKGAKTLLLIIALTLTMAGSQTSAQPENDMEPLNADELYKNATNSDYSELWEQAIELYKEGARRFPQDERFPWALGNLYYSRALYGLAWDEYKKTEAITPDNAAALIRLARTAGYLNRDSVSVDYYERALEIDPDNKEAIGSLGWMYFKVHRLSDGEKLLSSALERFGDDADFSMTIGTIFSDMYRYNESKYWYKKAISMGESYADRAFTSVAWYNLSILESRFYQYELCMEAVNSSLGLQNRASGHLALGELYKGQLKLEEAQKEYETAFEVDTTQLAKLSLAHVYQISGRLEEARLYAEDCLKNSDNSWMLNFGIDPVRYKRDIRQTLANVYYGLAKTEPFMPKKSLFKIAMYKLKYTVNLKLYRKYSLAAANAYGETFEDGGSHLESINQYYNAFGDYPRRAITYLNSARAFETALIPASTPYYDIEEGVLLRKNRAALVEKALGEFDPLWEKEAISKCCREFAAQKNRKLYGIEPARAAEELFSMNRGALRQAGIKLPAQMTVTESQELSKKNLEKILAKAGFQKDPNARYKLFIVSEGNRWVSCELIDTKGETPTISATLQLRDTKRADFILLAKNLGDMVFTVTR